MEVAKALKRDKSYHESAENLRKILLWFEAQSVQSCVEFLVS